MSQESVTVAIRPQATVRYAYNGSGFGVPAQKAGEELAKIEERDGGLVPRVIVNESRPEDAILHPCFEWNDEDAAERYREHQASHLIRSIRVLRVESDGERKREVAFVSVTRSETKQREYVSTARAMSEEESRLQVLADALAQLRGLQKRYSQLQELSRVFAELDAVPA